MFDLSETTLIPSASKENESTGSIIDANSLINNDGNVPHIDVVQTFSPSSSPRRFVAIPLKLCMLVWVVSIMVKSIQNVRYPSFWLALTHWGWVATNAYFSCSILSAVLLWCCPSLGYDGGNAHSNSGGGSSDGKEAGLLVKVTWALLAIALPTEIVITILFWLLQFDGTFSYISIMVHGGGTILVFLDGFLISRIPLRMKQFLLFEAFSALYMIWSLIHAYSGIGNPYKGDIDEDDEVEKDDDAIYESLRWNSDFNGAAILAVGTLFLVNPIVFLICRTVSRMLPLRLNRKVATLELEPPIPF